MFGRPQLLAIGGIDAQHSAVATSVQHDIFVDHQTWTKVEVELIAARDWFGLPNAIARGLLETDQLFAIVKAVIGFISGQRQRRNLSLLGPKLFARLGIEGHDYAWLFIPKEIASQRLLPTVGSTGA